MTPKQKPWPHAKHGKPGAQTGAPIRTTVTNEAEYRQALHSLDHYTRTLREISTADTDPDLGHVAQENRIRRLHHVTLMAVRSWEKSR